jgi:hypothetical protein
LPTAPATAEVVRPIDSLKPPTLPPLAGPTPSAVPATPPPSSTRPAGVQPTPLPPGDWVAHVQRAQSWRVYYPRDLLKIEDLTDGVTIFISQDRATFLAVDTFMGNAGTRGNTGEGLRNRARDTLARIYGQPVNETGIIEQPGGLWETGVRFTTERGSQGEAVYHQRGLRQGDYRVFGFIYGFKTATASTMGPVGRTGRDSFAILAADPFTYCGLIGTADWPPPVNPFGGVLYDDTKLDFFKTPSGLSLYWRCWDGKVLVCEPGVAGFPCTKPDTSRQPPEGLVIFCRQEPNNQNPPAAATGHSSIYEWACRNGTPVIVRQIIPFNQIDGLGYLIGPWVEAPRQGTP